MDLEQEYDKIFSKNYSGYEPQLAAFVSDIPKYKKSGKVLDVGAGIGQNSLFLAKNGFEVEAIDLSEEGLRQIKEAAKDLLVSTKKMDIKTTPLVTNYDVILCNFVLHHFDEEERAVLFKTLKQHTLPGGLHLISAFVQKDGTTEKKNAEGLPIFLPAAGDLQNIYSDWEILEFKETAAKPLKEGKPLVEFIETILARKK